MPTRMLPSALGDSSLLAGAEATACLHRVAQGRELSQARCVNGPRFAGMIGTVGGPARVRACGAAAAAATKAVRCITRR